MTIQHTRTITALTAFTLATGLLAGHTALAQAAYPSKPVTVIVPHAAGAAIGRLHDAGIVAGPHRDPTQQKGEAP